MKKPELCEYGNYYQDGSEIGLICDNTKTPCSYIRWCNTNMCLSMTGNHKDCIGRKSKLEENKSEKDIEEINYEETQIKENKKTKVNKEVCKILWAESNKVAFDFMGYGISYIVSDFDVNKKEIEVKYKGTIGKKDFEIIDVK